MEKQFRFIEPTASNARNITPLKVPALFSNTAPGTPGTPPRHNAPGFFKAPAITALILAFIIMIAGCGVAIGVSYYHDSIFVTQSTVEGAEATIKSIALPIGFNGTLQEYTVTNWINVTTAIDSVNMVLSISASDQVQVQNFYNVLTLDLYDKATDTLAVTWNLLIDLSSIEGIAIPGAYTYYAILSYEPQELGTVSFSIDIDLVRT